MTTSLNGAPARTDTYTYDNNGNQTGLSSVEGGITSITDNTYDTFNQLIQTVLPGGSTLSYAYNGEGKRISKTAGGQTTRYLFEGSEVILELDGSGNTFAVNVRGTSLIARTTGGQTAYYICTTATATPQLFSPPQAPSWEPTITTLSAYSPKAPAPSITHIPMPAINTTKKQDFTICNPGCMILL